MHTKSRIISILLPLMIYKTSAAESIDYAKLDHRIFIDQLRAGSHDPSGKNQYFFAVTLSALRNTKDDLQSEVEKRKALPMDPVTFGQIEESSLVMWKPAAKPEESVFMDVSGDQLRQLVIQAMKEWKVREEDIALKVEISQYEKAKSFYFFGEDRLIGKANYYPLPATQFQAPARTNLKLNINDEFGASTVVKVKYKQPLDAETKTSAEPRP
jgi:hypothetical protein